MNTLHRFIEGPNEKDDDDDIFAELDAIENKIDTISSSIFDELEAVENEDEGDLLGGLKIMAGQMPSMVTDVIPETIGRAIRRGDETIDETALDKWIQTNAEERERAKTLTTEEREETWFKVPFTDVKVTKGHAEDAADSIGYSIVNAATTFGAKALTTLALAPVLTPIGSMIAGVGTGFIAGTAISQGATKDQFVEMVKDEWEMAHAGEQMTPELQQQWSDVYNEIEGDADWYGFWEAAPETVGNLLTLGIAKLPVGKAIGPLLGKIKGKIASDIGVKIAKTVGVPPLKLAAMLTEESITEMVTQKKQADLEYERGFRDKPLTYKEALEEVLPMVITTTPFMGAGIAGGSKLAKKLVTEKKEAFDDLEIIEQGKQPEKQPEKDKIDTPKEIFKGIHKDYVAGKLKDADLEALKGELPDTPAGKDFVKQFDSILAEGKKQPETATMEGVENQTIISNIETVGARVFGDEFEKGKIRVASETDEIKDVRTVAKALKLGDINFYESGGTQLDGVNGFYDTATKQIYINKDTERPLLVVMGHESLHKIKKDEPGLYSSLKPILIGKELGFAEYVENLNNVRRVAGLQEVSTAKASEEFIADFVGTTMTKPSFWKKLHEQDPNITKKLAEVLTDLINKIRKALTGRDAKKYFKDLDAIETEIAKIYAQYAKPEEKAETITSKAVRLGKAATKEQIDEAKTELKKVEAKVNGIVEQAKKEALAGNVEKATKLMSEAGIVGGKEAQPLREMIQASEGRDFEKKQREEAEKKKIEEPPATESVVQNPGDIYTGKGYRVASGRLGKAGETALDQVNFEADELGNEHVRTDSMIAAKKHGIDLSKANNSDIVWVTRDLETAKELYGYDEADPEEISLPKDAVVLTDLGGDGVLVYRGGKPEKAKKPRKQAEPGEGIRTLGGYIRFVGKINFLNFTGELRDMPLSVKYLANKKGVGIDQFVEMAIDDNWLEPGTTPSDFMEMLRTDAKRLLSQDRLTADLSDKKEYQKSAEEKKFEKEIAWEPEEPPEGKYVQMKAKDLPVGKELTILEGKSTTGWDVYRVTSKSNVAVTLMDGSEVELEPNTRVEVLKEDIDKTPKKGYKESEISEKVKPYEDKQQTFDFTFKEEVKGIPEKRVRMATTGSIAASSTMVRNVDEAASLLSHIRKSAQEIAYTIAVDKDGTILEIHKYSKGRKDAAMISTVETAGRILNIPNVDRAYFAHNHPSASTTASDDDIALASSIGKALGLKNISLDSFVIAGVRYRELPTTGQPLLPPDKAIKPIKRPVRIPEKERAIIGVRAGELPVISQPWMAIEHLKNELDNQEGFLFLSVKNEVVGFLKFIPGEKQKTITANVISMAEKLNASGFVFNSNVDVFINAKRERFLKALGKQMGDDLALHDIVSAGKSLYDADKIDAFKTDPKKRIDTKGNYEVIGSEEPLFSVKSIESKWKQRGVELNLYEDKSPSGIKRIDLDRIVVPKKQRKTGVGSQVLTDIVNYADKKGLRVEVSPALKEDAFGTTSKARLIKFYKRFGFVENKGRNKDFKTRKGMYRRPEETKLSVKEQMGLFDKPKPEQKDTFGEKKQKVKEKKIEPKAVFGQKTAPTGRKKKGTPTAVQLDLFEKNKKQIQTTMFSVKDPVPAWYSQMETVLEQKLPGKGTPESMKQAINAFAKKGEFKKEELEWSGIEEWLDDYELVRAKKEYAERTKGLTIRERFESGIAKETVLKKYKVTKQEVLTYLKENNVQIREVVKGESDIAKKAAEASERLREIRNELRGTFIPYVSGRPLRWMIKDANGKPVDVPKEYHEELEAISEAIKAGEDYFEGEGEQVGAPKFAQWQEPGGPLSRDTEILTDTGWKRIDKVNIGDIVLSRKDESGELEWVDVKDTPTIFSEKLYHFKNKSIDMMVSPCHQMVIEQRMGSRQSRYMKPARITAEKLWDKWGCRIPLTGKWKGKQAETMFGKDAGDVMEFIGWFIAEGWSVKYGKEKKKSTLGIGQSKEKNPENAKRLEGLFDRLEFKWNYVPSGMGYCVGIRNMPKGLVALCHSQGTAKEKFIPSELLKNDVPLLERLHESLMLGDGCTHVYNKGNRKPQKTYNTISKRLADDFQILTLLIGYRGRVSKRKDNDNRKNGLYCIGVNYGKYATVDDAKYAIVDYNDTAFCVTVKNHAIYVRRNGIAAFTGNSNYKEVLLTLPESGKIPSLDSYIKFYYGSGGEKWLRETNPAKYDEAVRNYEEEIESGRGFAKGVYDEEPGRRELYTGGHYEEPNVLAHMRVNERTDTEGDKVMFLEEIQSDWHQKGRTEGYKKPTPEDLEKRIKEMSSSLASFRFPTGESTAMSGDGLVKWFRDLDRRLKAHKNNKYIKDFLIEKFGDKYFVKTKKLADRLETDSPLYGNVPDAPFKKSWPMLIIKRAVRMAAEGGFNSLGWTPGEIQAARYDLSKQVDKIIATKLKEGWKLSALLPNRGFENDQTEIKSGVSDKELPEYIGKDLADKVLSDKFPLGQSRIYEGEDLKVGGEGMKSFYDKMLVNEVNKFFNKKKWGKAKVGVSKVETGRKKARVFDIREDEPTVHGRSGWYVITPEIESDEVGFYESPSYETEEEALAHLAAWRNTEAELIEADVDLQKRAKEVMEIWSLPITPEIKQKALREGMPMFSVKDKKLSPLAQEYLDMLIVAHTELTSESDTKDDPFRGLRKEVAERMELNKGLGKPSRFEKVKKFPKSVWKLFTRTFEELDPKQYGGISNVLRLHKEVSTSSRRRASTLIYKIIGGLHPNQYDIFRMEIIMGDMLKDIESGLLSDREGLPFGFKNKAEVKAYHDELMRSVNADPVIKNALERRNLVNKKLKTVLVSNGLLHDSVLEDDRYFHHQVMEYRAAKELGNEYTLSAGTGTQALTMRKKGWQKARKGSIKEYNTDYFQSEFEVLAQGFSQLETKHTLNRLKGLIDMTAGLKLQAKAMEIEWKDFALPEGLVAWQPAPGSAWFRASSLTDKMMMAIQAGDITDPNIIKNVWAKGKDATWIVPKEIAKTLDDFGKGDISDMAIDKFSRTIITSWKKWILINPYRIIKYNLNNMSGDFDIAFAYDPKIMKYFNQARKDLWSEFKGKPLSKELKGELDLGYRQGVVGSGWAMQDIEGVARELSYDKKIQELTDTKPGYIKRAWKWSADITTFRENILRLAAYRYFKDRIDRGEKNIYAASNKEEVDAIQGDFEKAAKLARDLIGDYGNISAGGQWLRRHMIPFYSWMEVNAPRYVRLIRNLKHEGEGKKGARIAGVAATRIAWKGTKLAVKATALMGMVMLFNRTFHPDEEDELSETQRRQLHLILGRRKDGTIMTIRFQGALSDALSWFGGEDIVHDVKDVISGKVPITEKAKDAALAPVVKIINGIRPDIKTVAELLAGESYYPDPFFPRPIRDNIGHVARLFSLNSITDYLTGKPKRGGGSVGAWLMNDIIALGVYTSDPGEAAFWNVKKVAYKYLDKIDVEKPRISPTNKSNAMYYYKRALKYGDLKAAEKYLKKYIDLGGTRKGMKLSIRYSSPLGMMSKKQRRDFLKILTEQEKQTLNIAEAWFKETYRNPKNAIAWPSEYYMNLQNKND